MVRQTVGRGLSLAMLLVAAVAIATPVTAAAQEGSATAGAVPIVAVPAPVIGPVHAPAGIVRAEAVPAEALYLQNSGRGNRNVVWMIVGGGLLLGGMIVGGDVGTVLSVTGLVVGLVGVYRYLQ